MKGIIFTEFLDMVEQKFGLETVDALIEGAKLPSKGCYTAVGTYDYAEMQELILGLSNKTNVPIDQLLHSYGQYFFNSIVENYASILSQYQGPIDLLNSVESHIHVQVRKIYPDAELPRFITENRTNESLTLIYYSDRSLYMFAKGLMERTFEHYDKECDIRMEKITDDGTQVRFFVTQLHG